MRASELIRKLQELDPNREVVLASKTAKNVYVTPITSARRTRVQEETDKKGRRIELPVEDRETPGNEVIVIE